MNKLSKIATGVAITSCLMAGQAFASTDGMLGVDSTGTSRISLAIADRVQISGISDINLGVWSGSGNMSGSTDFCVYRNGGDNYQLTATTDNGAFQVSSGTTLDTIPFSASISMLGSSGSKHSKWWDAHNRALKYNRATNTTLTGSDSLTCGGSYNARLQVDFAQRDLQKASSANDYKATLTLYVQPI